MTESPSEKLEREAAIFRRVFGTDEGKKVLEILKQEFPADPDKIHVPGQPGATEYRLGCSAPIHFVNQMINHGEHHE